MSNDAITGGCLCGHVRYTVTEAPRSQGTCYCENCRRAGGAPSVAWVSVTRGMVDFTAGEPSRYVYEREDGRTAERTFCGQCGTQLTYDAGRGHHESVDITTAALDDPEAFPPEGESWVEEKLSWVKQ